MSPGDLWPAEVTASCQMLTGPVGRPAIGGGVTPTDDTLGSLLRGEHVPAAVVVWWTVVGYAVYGLPSSSVGRF